MTIQEMIRKFDLKLAIHNGEEAIHVRRKLTKTQIEEIKAKKPEIISELKAKKAAEEAKKEADSKDAAEELEAFKNSTKQIEVRYYDGEYLSGYCIYGQAAKLLEELGLSKYVPGWGNLVDSKFIDTVGEKFTYKQAVEYSQPARDAEAAKQAAKEAARQAKFNEAKETGKPVELERYTTDCNDPREECSTDIVTVWAMPDGSTKTTRQHTW
jgi:hypothetical protein